MAEEQFGIRRDILKELAPWTKLFSAFKIALDPKKLVLAGGGVLTMALGWYLLSVVFFSFSSNKPEWNADQYPDLRETDKAKREAAWQSFKRDRRRWYLRYELAGTPRQVPVKLAEGKEEYKPHYEMEDIADLASSPDEFDLLVKGQIPLPRPTRYKPYGQFLALPWFEDRGPNPYLLVTGAAGPVTAGKSVADTGGGIVQWFLTDQIPVLLEPLFKFFKPIIYLFDPAAGFWNHVYLLLIIMWAMATWAFFGGAITRIAVVQVARPNERVSLQEAAKFVWVRYKAFFSAPLFPLVLFAFLTVVLFVFGLLEAWGFAVGDILLPLLWPIALLIALVMAVVLVGLVGWPLMYATISAEGSEAFDAISRSYSYVYQNPWHYLWYSFVALAYGAVLVFFVGFMGSLLVYLAKWSVTLPPTPTSREPSYLFAHAPTSFGWRDLLLHKSPNATPIWQVNRSGREERPLQVNFTPDYQFAPSNRIGAFLVSLWLYLLFLLIVGFGYSYFWTASTIIYLLMRQKVDDTELDEIHMEEEPEQPFFTTTQTPPGAAPAPGGLQMVESPQIKGSEPSPPPGHSPGTNPGPDAGHGGGSNPPASA